MVRLTYRSFLLEQITVRYILFTIQISLLITCEQVKQNCIVNQNQQPKDTAEVCKPQNVPYEDLNQDAHI